MRQNVSLTQVFQPRYASRLLWLMKIVIVLCAKPLEVLGCCSVSSRKSCPAEVSVVKAALTYVPELILDRLTLHQSFIDQQCCVVRDQLVGKISPTSFALPSAFISAWPWRSCAISVYLHFHVLHVDSLGFVPTTHLGQHLSRLEPIGCASLQQAIAGCVDDLR
jgi:hypothetical protein